MEAYRQPAENVCTGAERNAFLLPSACRVKLTREIEAVRQALRPISRGCLVAIRGETGSGKSTFAGAVSSNEKAAREWMGMGMGTGGPPDTTVCTFIGTNSSQKAALASRGLALPRGHGHPLQVLATLKAAADMLPQLTMDNLPTVIAVLPAESKPSSDEAEVDPGVLVQRAQERASEVFGQHGQGYVELTTTEDWVLWASQQGRYREQRNFPFVKFCTKTVPEGAVPVLENSGVVVVDTPHASDVYATNIVADAEVLVVPYSQDRTIDADWFRKHPSFMLIHEALEANRPFCIIVSSSSDMIRTIAEAQKQTNLQAVLESGMEAGLLHDPEDKARARALWHLGPVQPGSFSLAELLATHKMQEFENVVHGLAQSAFGVFGKRILRSHVLGVESLDALRIMTGEDGHTCKTLHTTRIESARRLLAEMANQAFAARDQEALRGLNKAVQGLLVEIQSQLAQAVPAVNETVLEPAIVELRHTLTAGVRRCTDDWFTTIRDLASSDQDAVMNVEGVLDSYRTTIQWNSFQGILKVKGKEWVVTHSADSESRMETHANRDFALAVLKTVQLNVLNDSLLLVQLRNEIKTSVDAAVKHLLAEFKIFSVVRALLLRQVAQHVGEFIDQVMAFPSGVKKPVNDLIRFAHATFEAPQQAVLDEVEATLQDTYEAVYNDHPPPPKYTARIRLFLTRLQHEDQNGTTLHSTLIRNILDANRNLLHEYMEEKRQEMYASMETMLAAIKGSFLARNKRPLESGVVTQLQHFETAVQQLADQLHEALGAE